MPFHEETHFLLSSKSIETDEDAELWLPPYAIVHTSYAGYRAEGSLPQEALQQTLALWREFQASARPSSYGKTRLPEEGTYEEERLEEERLEEERLEEERLEEEAALTNTALWKAA